MEKPKLKVFIVCTGLGRIWRGFESHTQECFEALSRDDSLDLTLFKGGGDSSEREITLWNLSRESWMAAQLGRLIRRDAYCAEQVSFFLSLLPKICSRKPDIIYFSDFSLGNLLWRWRRLTKQKYKLLFSNGAPMAPPFPFERWHHVHQVTPVYFQLALKGGFPAERQSMIPYGTHIGSRLQLVSSDERKTLCRKLELPDQRPLIISVGAINKYHKRMDYVVREVADLPEPRPYLLLLGQQEEESPEIIKLGKSLLGEKNFQVRTVKQDEVADYYKVATAFVLASLSEGFGRVFLEAMSHGLPCLTHDYEISRYILGEEGYLADLSLRGSLANLLRRVLVEDGGDSKRRLRHRRVYDHFSWENLRSSYVDMLWRCQST